MKYNLEMNKMDYQKEKENRKKRLEAYAEEIQKSTLKKSAEVIEQLVEAQSGTSGKWNKSTDAGCVRKIRISPWDAYRN